ncbi:hypothetical protein RUND412_002246 [Rhizina undulata]
MSACSSPTSQRSPFPSTSSSGYLSPNTAVTTPSSVGATSPKIEGSYTYNQTSYDASPPSDQVFSYTQPLSPPSDQVYNYAQYPSSSQIPYGYGYTHVPSPSQEYAFAQASSPSANIYQPQNYPQSPAVQLPTTSRAKYPGYPPASAFYGPSPNSPTSASSSRHQRPRKPIDPEQYQIEQWYTADGRRVEYSAMHLHCATM